MEINYRKGQSTIYIPNQVFPEKKQTKRNSRQQYLTKDILPKIKT